MYTKENIVYILNEAYNDIVCTFLLKSENFDCKMKRLVLYLVKYSYTLAQTSHLNCFYRQLYKELLRNEKYYQIFKKKSVKNMTGTRITTYMCCPSMQQ